MVNLPYIKEFKELDILAKARPIQINSELLTHCRKEIQDIDKRLIRSSKNPLLCVAFYVNNAAKKECGVPRLVRNHKPLNKVLDWIRYPTLEQTRFT